MVGPIQDGFLLIVGIAALALEVYALIDSFRYSNEEYYAAGKRNKAFWTALTGSAVTVGFLTLPAPVGRSGVGPTSLIGLAAVVVAVVFLAKVRPMLLTTRMPPRTAKGGR